MPNFKFSGRDANSQLVSGQRFAESSDHLGKQLLNEGVTPIQISLQEDHVPLLRKIKTLIRPKKITNSELALFTRQMYTLIKAGIIISTAMKNLSTTARSLHMSQVLLDISQKLESGQNLALAMENHRDVFTPLMIAMIQIGQNTGQLDNAFLRLTEYLELEESTIKKVKTAIRYPVIVMTSIVIGMIIVNIFVIPAFAKVYLQANIALPLMTLILIKISTFFIDFWVYILVFIVIAGIFLRRYLKSPQGKYAWHKQQLKIPIIGFLLQRMTLLRFSETFTIVVNSGIPISEGLALVAQSLTNEYARQEVMTMKNAIQRGSSIFQAASACDLFTGMELQMLAIGEETGDLAAMLQEITAYYQREVNYDLKYLTDIIEPLMLSAIAIMVLFMALAVYMPIWSMVKLVHKG